MNCLSIRLALVSGLMAAALDGALQAQPYGLTSRPDMAGYLNDSMPDPTLRLHVAAPVSNLAATNTGTVALSWSPSLETNALYFVYRSTNSFDGPFVKLTSNPISATSYVDTSPPSGLKTYQVRALNLITSGSGSYTNLSQGIFISLN